jgi:hypothetical protein
MTAFQGDLIPAVAFAKPPSVAAFVGVREAQDGQLAEALVGDIFEIVFHPWRIPQLV